MQERAQLTAALDEAPAQVKQTNDGPQRSSLTACLAGLFIVWGVAGLCEFGGVLLPWLAAPLRNMLAWTVVMLPGCLALGMLSAGVGLASRWQWAWHLALVVLIAGVIWEVTLVALTFTEQAEALPGRFMLAAGFSALGKGIRPLGYLVMMYFLMSSSAVAALRAPRV